MALITKKITLDITPGAIPQIVNVSEYDENRQFTVNLIDEGGVFEIPGGTTAKVEGTIGGSGFSENATISGDTITFTLTESMTAKSGDVWCKIKLTKDSKPIQTCAFILRCDRAGVEAKTIINVPGFQEQINTGVAAWLESHQPFFTLPSGGLLGQVLGSDGNGGAIWVTNSGGSSDSIIDDDGTAPSYVLQEAQRLVNAVNSHGVTNGFRILALSDAHIDKTNAQWVESAEHAGMAAKLIRSVMSFDCCMHLGDATNGASATTYDVGVEEIGMMRSNLADAFANLPQFWTVGNHDNLNYSSAAALGEHTMLYAEDLYPLIGALSTGTVDPQNPEGGYCYQDFTSKKIRVICLNSVEVYSDSSSKSQWISGRQVQWFAEKLGEVGQRSGWGIIVCAHHPIDWMTFRVSQVLKAYLGGTSVSLSYDGVTISYDFSGKNSAKFICQLHGHVHNYLAGKINAVNYANGAAVLEGEMEARRLAIPNVCFGRNNEYGRNSTTESNGIEFGEETTYNKTAQSGEDTAFCIITVDLANGRIYADHYGAGRDRMVSYKSTLYSIDTSGIGKATLSNTATAIEAGATYQTGVSVPSGYTIENVVVTMGGVQVAGAYSSGTISIPNVTGDIVITITASGYENIIDTIGYTDGKRLSTSKGTLSDATGYTTTGFIDLTPFVDKGETVVIRTSGVDMRSSTHSNSTWCYYRANETFVGGGYMNNLGDANTNGAATFDEGGNMTLTLSGTSYPLTTTGNRPLLRLAGYGSGANLIVTINEVIA